MIFNYMKMLDPGSTVREGEFATARNTAGVPQMIRNLYNKLNEGELLGDDQRKDFVDRAGQFMSRQQSQHNERIKTYSKLAKRNGLDVEDVVIDLNDPRFNIEDLAAEFPQRRKQIEAALSEGYTPEQIRAFLGKK